MIIVWQITYKQLCFGIAGTNRIEQAAPCCAWAIGKPVHQVLNYWERRGAKVKELFLAVK